MSTRKCENCGKENVAKYGFQHCQYCYKPIGRNKDRDLKRLREIEAEKSRLEKQLNALNKTIWDIEHTIGENAEDRRKKAIALYHSIVDLEQEKKSLNLFWSSFGGLE